MGNKIFICILCVFFGVANGAEISIEKQIVNGGSVQNILAPVYGDIVINNSIALKKNINGSVINKVYYISNKEYVDKKWSLSWLTEVSPKKINYSEITSYISSLNIRRSSNYRLPTFDELNVIQAQDKVGREFSDLEVWAQSENGEVSFYDLEFGDPLSGNQFGSRKRYLLLVRDLL